VPTASGSAGPSGVPVGVSPTAIYLSEWSVALPTSLPTGQLNVLITNIGTMPHELLAFRSDLPPSAYPVDSNGDIIENGPGITLVSDGDNLDPGTTQPRVIDLTQPGTYLFVCNLPGHFKAGMFRVVTVTPPAQQQAYIPAALSEWHIAAPSTISAGSVILEAANFGTIPHELLVFKSDLLPAGYPLDADGNIVEDGPGIALVSDGENLDPGTTQTRTADLTQPGAYLFVCNIPGHFKQGMYTVVTVTR
jgi:plastocyanin